MIKLPLTAVGALTLSAALSGCISLGAKPPPSLLTLTATSPVSVGQAQSSASSPSILILVPTVPQSLATARVPVQTSDTDVAYLKEALWIEPPQRLFARLLADTVTSRTGRVVLSAAQSASDPGATLNGELRNFGVVATGSEVVVTYDASLIRGGRGRDQGAVEKRRFEARVPVTTIAPQPVAVALNQAANQVAGEVSDWVGR